MLETIARVRAELPRQVALLGFCGAPCLLPPENATGNYVKVVQRVPVKIVFDDSPDAYLGPGMSVVPDVKVR